MKLVLAMAVTILGLIAILSFVKPSKKELEAFKNLERAKKEFIEAIAKVFKLDTFVDWLSKKLK